MKRSTSGSIPASARSEATLVGHPAPKLGRERTLRGRRAQPALAAQLKNAAAAAAWRFGWNASTDVEVADGVCADVLCRNDRTSIRIAIVIRPDAPSSEEVAAIAATFERERIRSAWFCGYGFVAPPFDAPRPVFRIAGSTLADAVAMLPEAGLALPFADALDALFDARIRWRERLALRGPWWLALAAVRIRCWRCGAAFAAVSPRAARADSHDRLHEVSPETAASLASRAFETVRFLDSRGDPIASPHFGMRESDRSAENACPECEAVAGPAMLAEIWRAAPTLAPIFVAFDAPDSAIASPHWCVARGPNAAGCCPETSAGDAPSWLATAKPHVLEPPAQIRSLLNAGRLLE